MGDWIGMAEAKEILGLSHNTVTKLIRQGVLPAYQVPGVRGPRFHRADVENLIQRIEPTPVKDPTSPVKKSKKRQ